MGIFHSNDMTCVFLSAPFFATIKTQITEEADIWRSDWQRIPVHSEGTFSDTETAGRSAGRDGRGGLQMGSKAVAAGAGLDRGDGRFFRYIGGCFTGLQAAG